MTVQSPDQTLQSARKALNFRRYPEAIVQLEQYLRTNTTQDSNHFQAKMWLVKAHQGAEQMTEAIALCHELRGNGSEVAKIWADRYLTTLAPPEATLPEAAPSNVVLQGTPLDIPAPPSTTCQQKTVAEFKVFCQTHLMKDLKALEEMRQSVQRSLFFVAILSILICGAVVKGYSAFNDAIISSETKPKVTKNCDMKTDPNAFACIVKQHENQNVAQTPSVKSPPARARQERRSQGFWIQGLVVALLVLVGTVFCWVAFYASALETYSRQFKVKITERILEFVDSTGQLRYHRQGLRFSGIDGHNRRRGILEIDAIEAFSHSMIAPRAEEALYCSEKDCVSGVLGQTEVSFSQVHIGVEKKIGLSQFDLTHYIDLRWARVFPPLMVLYAIGLIIKLIGGLVEFISSILRGGGVNFDIFEKRILSQGPEIQTIFKGIFFRAQFNKTLPKRVTIVPKSWQSKVTHARDWGKLVKLEDPAFAQQFLVYSDDQVAARYALSTRLMERLVTFARKANRPLYLSIVEDRIYIGLKSDREALEPSLFYPMTNFNPIRDYFETLQLLLGIVDDLNLNQRIWMQ